jgi:hypothetical protein
VSTSNALEKKDLQLSAEYSYRYMLRIFTVPGMRQN